MNVATFPAYLFCLLELRILLVIFVHHQGQDNNEYFPTYIDNSLGDFSIFPVFLESENGVEFF